MSSARVIIEMGAGVSLAPDGKIKLSGLKSLPKEKRQAVLSLARDRKEEITRELQFSSRPCEISEISELSPLGLESIMDRPPPDADFWEWSGAIDLKDIARQYGLKVRQSVRGSILVVYPAQVNVQLVQYAEDCLQDCQGYLARFPGIPALPPAEALTEFRRMGGEVQHVQGGFVPVYPEEWPGYVKDAAQALFLAALDAIEEEDRQDVERAVKTYTGGNR